MAVTKAFVGEAHRRRQIDEGGKKPMSGSFR